MSGYYYRHCLILFLSNFLKNLLTKILTFPQLIYFNLELAQRFSFSAIVNYCHYDYHFFHLIN